jgi:sugar lactone lactonase YvrE
MKRRYIAVLVSAAISALIAVSGCNEGGSVAPISPQRPVLRPESGGTGSNLVWVANINGNELTAYKVTDNGNVAPTQSVVGPATQLNGPYGLFETARNLYVCNVYTPSITIYPVSANGNVAPKATIAGSNTKLNGPNKITVNQYGTIVIDDAGKVLTFAPGKFGNVAPIRAIEGPLTKLAVDVNGITTHNGFIYVANEGAPGDNYPPNIVVFHELDNGNVAPVREIVGPHTGLNLPAGLKFDSAGNLYVPNGGANTVTEYAPGAHGDASPVATLQGSNTLLFIDTSLFIDNQTSRMYVTNLDNNLLTGYTLPINGDQTPFMAIQGSNTQLDFPEAVAH